MPPERPLWSGTGPPSDSPGGRRPRHTSAGPVHTIQTERVKSEMLTKTQNLILNIDTAEFVRFKLKKCRESFLWLAEEIQGNRIHTTNNNFIII